MTSPVQVWISDSDTFVKVTISVDAAKNFQHAHRRRITEGTLGALFQLLRFEVVAQHYGPKKTKVTMLIHELKHIGSDGSQAFGRPRTIESLEDIQELLNEIQAFRAQSMTIRQSSHNLQPGVSNLQSPSQSNGILDGDGDDQISQGLFATQAPPNNAMNRAGPEPYESKSVHSDLNGVGNTFYQNFDSGIPSNLNLNKILEATKEERLRINSTTPSPKLVENGKEANYLGKFDDSRAKEDADRSLPAPPSEDERSRKRQVLRNLLSKRSKPKSTGAEQPISAPKADQVVWPPEKATSSTHDTRVIPVESKPESQKISNHPQVNAQEKSNIKDRVESHSQAVSLAASIFPEASAVQLPLLQLHYQLG